MTNGEKFKEVFGISQVDEGELYAYAWLPNHDAAEFCIDWWNAEYKEPITENDKIDCEHTDCNNCVNHKYCDYEPTTKSDLGVDVVSRQAVIDLMMQKWGENFSGDDAMQESIDAIRVMPSTPQEPKTGHWITRPHIYGVTYCSECDFELKIDNTNYCPNCGAKMVEPQESEDI
jgi:hypothetical protein